MVTYGTCAFGATAETAVGVKVGNEDVRDLIRDSIAKFSWQGKVGAGGRIEYNGGVTWGLYHT
jgi:hypothetical protein